MTNYTSIQQGGDNDDDDAESCNRPTTSIISNKHKTLMGGFVAVVGGLAVAITTNTTRSTPGIDNIDSAASVAAAAAMVVVDDVIIFHDDVYKDFFDDDFYVVVIDSAAAAAAVPVAKHVFVIDSDDTVVDFDVTVRDCTFNECFDTSCDKKLAPFVCERWNGGPMGGCSPTPWLEGTCDDFCNLSNCESLPIPPTTDSCQDVQCSIEWCESPQLCGSDVPYQCTNGSGRFGCSDDPLQWTLRSSTSTCSECCDITTCGL